MGWVASDAVSLMEQSSRTACAAVRRGHRPARNADLTVILWWFAARKRESVYYSAAVEASEGRVFCVFSG